MYWSWLVCTNSVYQSCTLVLNVIENMHILDLHCTCVSQGHKGFKNNCSIIWKVIFIDTMAHYNKSLTFSICFCHWFYSVAPLSAPPRGCCANFLHALLAWSSIMTTFPHPPEVFVGTQFDISSPSGVQSSSFSLTSG